ncbi:hypothetical protein Ciccas_001299 [Cichlidogyrus casuarinus]|uniref:USP domain-containing protein n=1 Tax=Cichlidogyrus casuarinus TaxID=1844966 RepID=A0ABD2QKF2_9PLAT
MLLSLPEETAVLGEYQDPITFIDNCLSHSMDWTRKTQLARVSTDSCSDCKKELFRHQVQTSITFVDALELWNPNSITDYESMGQRCGPECRRVLTVSEVINWPQALVIAFHRACEIQISAYEILKKPGSPKFKLKAVLVYTSSPRHYYVLALRGKCWFCLNDSKVTAVESTALQFCSAVLLVYERDT